jgi:hypothetical protein
MNFFLFRLLNQNLVDSDREARMSLHRGSPEIMRDGLKPVSEFARVKLRWSGK